MSCRCHVVPAAVPPHGLHAADIALDGFSVLTTGRRAHGLPPDTRARLLRRPTRLPGFETLMDDVKIPLLLAAGASRHGSRPVRPFVRADPCWTSARRPTGPTSVASTPW
ncbi:hypothetical protein [Streptomyces collinus]|uniref:hypothetical protein n=1 Tax=Streptomyces collinus TaxID=42684 RepID=UPI00382F585D